MGDYDNMMIFPRKDQFLIETSRFHYHLIDFTQELDFSMLLYKLQLTQADKGFIKWTAKHGYAQLRIGHGKIIRMGVFPDYELKMLAVKVR